MMRGELSLQFLGDDEQDSRHVEVRADGGTASGVVDTYISGEELLDIARRLTAAATTGSTTIVWEQGSPHPDDNWALHLLLAISPLDNVGHQALLVRIQSHGALPSRRLVELAIPATPADLDRLAEGLRTLAKDRSGSMTWVTSPS